MIYPRSKLRDLLHEHRYPIRLMLCVVTLVTILILVIETTRH